MPKDNTWEKVTAQAGSSDIWDYKEGKEKELVGILKEKKENVGPNNSMLYVIQKEDESEIGIWGTTVLNTKFSEIIVGEEVKITYKGKVKNPTSNREYHDFEVYHRPSGEIFNE